MQTLQLLKDVPSQPGALYQTFQLVDNTTYKLRVRAPSQEWWNPRFWSNSLQSVVVKGRRCDKHPSVDCTCNTDVTSAAHLLMPQASPYSTV